MRHLVLTVFSVISITFMLGASKPKTPTCEAVVKDQVSYLEARGFFPVRMVPFSDNGIVILFDSNKESSRSYALFFLLDIDGFEITKDTDTIAKGTCSNEGNKTLYYFLLSRLETEEANNRAPRTGPTKGASK